MDAASNPAVAGTAEDDKANFMKGQADEDVANAKVEHCGKGLRTAKDLLSTMQKAVAHGLATDDDDMKRSCLAEIGECANAVRLACKRAIEDSEKETRNLQK